MRYNCKKITLMMAMLGCMGGACGQQVLTLDDCHRMALASGSAIGQAKAKHEQTEALEKAALWQMLPKVSANGGYMWMEKSVNLLSEEQKDKLGNLGSTVQNDLGPALHQQLGDALPVGGEALATRLENAFASSSLYSSLTDLGQNIVDGMQTDTRNMGVAVVTVTQPIYTGGKLTALYRTARLMNRLSGLQLSEAEEKALAEVDEAYWQVVSVESKKHLAEQYAALLDTLEQNVQLAVGAEIATVGDLAKVRVKQSEAHMTLTKATNGLALSKMLLAQRCGMPLDSDFELSEVLDAADAGAMKGVVKVDSTLMAGVIERRGEMQMLGVLDSVAREGVRASASALKPNIVATGGYLVSNPNIFDGFSNTWGGTFLAGVAVNIPILHPGGIYAVKAAKAKRREVQLQSADAREMIELQVNKLNYELILAYQKLAACEEGLEAARENLRFADESFKAGMCSSSDLLMAQTAWMQAESEVLDTRIEIAMGRLYLNQALGK